MPGRAKGGDIEVLFVHEDHITILDVPDIRPG
jgi:hypothetical protein